MRDLWAIFRFSGRLSGHASRAPASGRGRSLAAQALLATHAAKAAELRGVKAGASSPLRRAQGPRGRAGQGPERSALDRGGEDRDGGVRDKRAEETTRFAALSAAGDRAGESATPAPWASAAAEGEPSR